MSEKKQYIMYGLAVVAIIFIISFVYGMAEKEKYPSDDPLYGSFYIEYPAPSDFLVSIDVPTTHRSLVECAKRSGVDISKGCWVYSFAEDKVFRAEKKDNKLLVYEDEKQIAMFKYSAKKLLWHEYDIEYYVVWRNEDYTLHRQLQGFVFP